MMADENVEGGVIVPGGDEGKGNLPLTIDHSAEGQAKDEKKAKEEKKGANKADQNIDFAAIAKETAKAVIPEITKAVTKSVMEQLKDQGIVPGKVPANVNTFENPPTKPAVETEQKGGFVYCLCETSKADIDQGKDKLGEMLSYEVDGNPIWKVDKELIPGRRYKLIAPAHLVAEFRKRKLDIYTSWVNSNRRAIAPLPEYGKHSLGGVIEADGTEELTDKEIREGGYIELPPAE